MAEPDKTTIGNRIRYILYDICNINEFGLLQDMCTSKPGFTKSKKHNGFDDLKLRIHRRLSI